MEKRDDQREPLCWQLLEQGIITPRERLERALAWLRENPDSYDGLVRNGYFKSYKTAQRAISKAEEKGEIECIGQIQDGNGRPAKVYCGYRSKCIRHDLLGTELRAAYFDVPVERGEKLPHSCDIMFKFAPDKDVFGELDTGSMTLNSKQKDRWRQYDGAEGIVMVVTLKRKRMENLQAMSHRIANIAVFGVLEEVCDDPWGRCFENIDGVAKSIEEVWEEDS